MCVINGIGRKSIVVFASGRGSNFRALCEAEASGHLAAKIEALVTNVRGTGAAAIAREFAVPLIELPHDVFSSRVAHEAAILKELKRVRIDWVVLAGYMRLLSEKFIRHFWDENLGAARILNIHPSLLPLFPGRDGYAQALQHGVKVTGATVHLVGPGLDDGPIIAQRAIEVRDDDTIEKLTQRGLAMEHELYVETLQRLLISPISLSCSTGQRSKVVFTKKLTEGERNEI